MKQTVSRQYLKMLSIERALGRSRILAAVYDSCIMASSMSTGSEIGTPESSAILMLLMTGTVSIVCSLLMFTHLIMD